MQAIEKSADDITDIGSSFWPISSAKAKLLRCSDEKNPQQTTNSFLKEPFL
jgi:hypothetical protein